MKWSKFEESERVYPDEIVNKLIKGFSNATGQVLELVVEPSLHNFGTRTDFEFRLLLITHKLENYRFKVLTFGYNVEIYPVSIILEDQIFFELLGKDYEISDGEKTYSNTSIQKNTEQAFEELMIKVFETKRFQEVVSGLLKISKKPDLVS